MNLDFCPNKKSKEFLEMVSALGGEDKAYFFWMRNNGNHLEKAPNGADSKLFHDLLEYFKDNRAEAIRAKAKVYTNEFFNWFGKWTEDSKENVSKVVDENGEPLVVWHGSNEYGFEEFDPSKADDKISIFATDSKFIASTYTDFQPIYSSLIKDRLNNRDFIEAIKNKDWDTAKRIVKSIYDQSVSREEQLYMSGSYGMYTYLSSTTGMQLPEDERNALLDLAANNEEAIKHHFSLNVKTSHNGKVTLTLEDDNDEGGRFINTAVLFIGSPELLLESIQKDTKIYSLFLNIKNPLILDKLVGEYGAINNWNALDFSAASTKVDDTTIWGEKTGRKKSITRTRDVAKYAKENGYDGVLFGEIIDHGGYQGDIKLNPVTDADIAYNYFHEGEDSYIGGNVYRSLVFIAFNPNQLKSVVKNNGKFSTTDDNIYHHTDKKVSGTGNLLDEIPKEGATTQLVVNNVVDFLKNKFVGLDIEVYDDVSNIPQQNDDDKRVIGILSSNKSIKSMVYHGKVYIIRSRLQKQGGQIASEEILHMLVKTLQQDNQVLFQKLLKEAKRTFKKLTKEIESTYESLGQDTINNEIVTQALARFVNRDIQQNRHSKFADLVELFVEWLKSIVRNAAEKLGNTVYIDPTLLKNLTLQELSDLINAEDTRFDVNISPNGSFYNMSNNSSSDIETNINSQREEYIQKIVDNYVKDSKLKDQELRDAIMRIRDNARQLFDEQELIRIESDNTISEQDKLTIKNLLLRDLLIVRGLQLINEIPEKTEDQKVFEQIKLGTKTRLKSQLSRNIKQTKLINDLKEQIANLEGVDENDIDLMFELIKQFLLNAEQEILKTKRFINELLIGKDISTWDPQQINYIRYDLLGYYEGLLRTVYGMFSGDSAIAKLNKAKLEEDPVSNVDLEDLTTRLYSMIDPLQTDYLDKVVLPYAEKVLVDFVNDSDVVTNKPQFITNMKKWLYQDTAYGDLAAGEVVLGMASRSRSPIVNIIEKMISDIEFEKNRQILKDGHELIRLYNKVRPTGSQMDFRNFQKMLMEMDGEDGTDGKYTGYFVRDRNYGRFYKEKDEFELKLREKYAKKGLTWKYNEFDDRYELIFPEEDYTAERSVYNQYYDELDEWLDKHCERRYTLEYYKKKRRFLSPQALQALLMIQRLIDILAQKAMTEEGYVDSTKLTPHERQRMKDLRKQKRELACPYIFDSLSDGTVTLVEKKGEDAEIARQITKWNKFIADHVKYKQNDEKFNAALSKFEKGSEGYKLFLADNRILIINPEFWKTILGNNVAEQTEKYKELKSRYKTIVEHIKNIQGFRTPDLDLLGLGINTDSSVWQELQRLELEMAEEYTPSEEPTDIDEYLNTFLVNSTKEDKKFLNWLLERWLYEIAADASKQEVFDKLFTFTDRKGRTRFLKIFSFTAPSSYSIENQAGEKIPTLVYQYSSQFSELDESSDFVNKNYKKELKTSMLPKVRKPGTKRVSGTIDYTNENYNKIVENEGYKQLYDKLLEMMEKSNSMIPQGAVERRYLLPLITGRGMSILGRSRGVTDIFTAVNYGLQDWAGIKIEKDGVKFDESLMEKDTDVSTNWDLPRRPDGTIVSNIPIRFVKRLEDPSIISSDVIGSVLLYYDMALNYKLKSEKLPALELIQEAINPERKAGGKKLQKQYDKVKNQMDYRYYGRESRMGSDDTKAHSAFEKSTMQISKKFRSLASMSMLALNFTTIEVGYLDAFLGAVADSVGGKYFTMSDLRTGYWLMLKALPKIIANLGNPVVDDWMTAAMQYNQLSKSNSEIFGRTDQSRWSRLLSETRMGGYTMADYMINTMILGATYNHYRLVDMPDGSNKRFMSKTDAINTFTKFGYTEKEAIEKWENAKTTLRQAYYQKDGDFLVHDDFKPYITKKLENQVAGRLRDRTAVYNGVIPTTEKATIQQNVFGSFLTLMRNFYVNTYWERARAGYDYATEEELQSSKFGMYTADSAGSVNFETGEFGNGLWFSALKGLYKYVTNVKALVQGKDLRQLTSDQKYAVKRILSEVAIIGGCIWAMLFSIAFARRHDYDDDKDPLWTVNIFDPEGEDRGILLFNGNNAGDKMLNWTRWKLALLMTRTFTERATFYWPGTITELISSPSTAKSYLDDLGYSLELFMDLFEINGHDRNEMVRSGGYKGMTRGTRDIMKITGATGIDNVIRNWHTSGIKSTLNWYQGVAPNNFLIPNKTTWEEQEGIKSSSKSGSKKTKLRY